MGGDGKCTFGTRPPVDLQMLNEKIYREVKHFRNYKTYRPNFGSLPVATKFYARHDQLKDESEEQTKKVADYAYNVAQTRAKGPHSKYPAPVTESHVYGWYTAPLVHMDRNDQRFYHPKKESSHTKIEVIIRMCNPKKRAGG
ncbi:cilia- and flagella-associated protein 144-like [Cydia pomonella]|uniref:cilia- and flagella-associated protein 144-like n=1 Tax=Cydia pomonella TaxID=82600 RepID=UPI002ADDEDD6|nr:cilia- and flagella-associated protein 144-like [Cydia pomonella]